MGLEVTLLSIRSLLDEATDALRTTPGTDRQIILKASEPVAEWVISSPGWPMRYDRSYRKSAAF